MAKVWKPKYWDAKNPPDAGARVFVGKANGASSYESIAAGQTKRILQSNGKGDIFYGNVTVPSPGSPKTASDITSLDLIPASSSTIITQTTLALPLNGRYYSIVLNSRTDCQSSPITTGAYNICHVASSRTVVSWRTCDTPEIKCAGRNESNPGGMNNFTQAQKCTIWLGNDWITVKLVGATYYSSGANVRVEYPTEGEANTNITDFTDFINRLRNNISRVVFTKEW